MADLLPPVALTLVANVTEAIAGVEAFGTSIGTMAGEAAVAGERTAAGLEAATAGVAQMAGAAEAESSKIVASNDRVLTSMRALSAQADRTAEQWYVDQTRMAAATQKMAADMEIATAKAMASTEAMGAKMDEVAATSTGFGATVATASKKMMLIGAGAAVVAIASVKMAADFESSTTRLVTSAGETEANLGKVREGILGMAGDVGYSAEELSKALYTIESGGQHGAEGLKVLRAAAEGAKTENAELKTVADAVTSVLVDYHLKADDAAAVTSKLVAATSAGKTTFEELSGSMAAVLPVASAAHVSIDDILGSLASMTVHGMSAQQAAQNLTDVIRHMQAPTQVQSKELALLGINAQDLAGKLQSSGISGTLQMIADKIKSSLGGESQKVILDLGTALKTLPKDVQDLGLKLTQGTITQKEYSKAAQGMNPIAAHQAAAFATLAASTHVIGGQQMTGAQVMQSYGQALYKATGDATGLNVALMLTGENADTTNNAVKTVAGAAVEAGNHVKGWAEIQGTFNQKVAAAKDGLGAMAIAIGEKLLPAASAIIGVLGTVVKWIADNQAVATAIAIVIGVVLVAALVAATIATWNFTIALLANPVVWIVIAIMALIAGIILLVKNWDTVAAWLKASWNVFVAWAKGVWDGFAGWWASLWNTVWKWCTDRLTDINHFVVTLFNTVINWIVNRWNDFIQFWVDLWNQIWKWCSDRLTDIRNWVQDRVNDVIHFFEKLGSLVGKTEDYFGRIKDAIIAKFWDAVHFVESIPGRILGALGDLGRLLWGAGSDLIQGLWNGISAAGSWLWGKITGFIDGIVSHAKSLLGISSPSKVMHEIGGHFVDGFANGILNGAVRAADAVRTMNRQVMDAHVASGGFGSISTGGVSGAAMSGGIGGAGGGNVYITVQGSIVAERDLQSTIREGVLQYNLRNPSNGLTAGLSTGGR